MVSSISLMLAAAAHYRLRRLRDTKIIPRLKTSHKHKDNEKLERFSHYVARQMGFKDRRDCPNLCKLAAEYISKSECCEEDIYSFFSQEPDADSLFIKLVEEFERCILSYFGFHWSHADLMISQVCGEKNTLSLL